MTKSIFGNLGNNMLPLFRFALTKKNLNNSIMMGRWNLDYDNMIQNRKVYWANMDHCGCCGCDMKRIEAVSKITKKDRVYKREDDSEEYILPYVM